MAENTPKPYRDLKKPEMPSGLFEKIVAKIIAEKHRRTAKQRIIIFSLTSVVSLFIFVSAFKLMQAELYRSGLLQLLSLVFSDPDQLLRAWSDALLLALESLPIFSIAGVLLAMFILLGSLKLLVRDISVAFRVNEKPGT